MNWSLTWEIFLGTALMAFLGLEISSIVTTPHNTTENTLSATLRRWLGVVPKQPRRWFFRLGFLALLVWFLIHILTPWL